VHVGVAGNRLFWINKLERDGREGKRRGQEARIKKGARWPALRRRLLLSLKKETGQEACRFRRRLELSWPAFGEAREQAEAQTEQHEKVSRGSPHPILSCLLASSSPYSSSSLSPLTFFCWLRAEVGAWQPNFSQTGDYHGADFLRGSFDWCHAGASVTSVSHRPCNKVVTLAVN